MAQQRFDFTLGLKVDTEQAKNKMNELTQMLNKISTRPLQLLDDQDLRDATKSAQELEQHLRKAVNVNTGKIDLSKFSKSLSSSNQNLQYFQKNLAKTGVEGERAFLKLSENIAMAEMPTIRLNGHLKNFLDELVKVGRWQLGSDIMHGLQGAVQTAYYYAQDLNESLTNIRIVTGQNTEEMAQFAKRANDAAKALSTTTTSYSDAALIFYQQGLSEAEVEERTNATIKMANATGQGVQTVSDQLTAVWNNFDDGSKSLEYYADVMAKLGAETASSTEEIATGIEKFASISNMIGLSYEYAASALTTVTDVTRQSADVVGTAFKTIFARIQGLNLGDTLEDGTTLNKYSKALETVGISIFDQNNQLKDMDNILDEMGAKWKMLGRDQQVALAQTVAGVRQYNQLVSLMENWDFFKRNVDSARNSEGALTEQASIYAEGWEASLKRVKSSAEGVYDALLDEDTFIKINDIFAKVLESVEGVVNGLGGMGGIVSSIGSIFMMHFAKKIPTAISNTIENLNIFTGKTRKQIQQLQADNIRSLMNVGITGYGSSAEDMNKESAQDKVRRESLIKIAELKRKLLQESKYMTDAEIKEAQALIANTEATYENAEAIAKKADEERKAIAKLKEDINKNPLHASEVQKEINKDFSTDYDKYLKIAGQIADLEAKGVKATSEQYQIRQKDLQKQEKEIQNLVEEQNLMIDIVNQYRKLPNDSYFLDDGETLITDQMVAAVKNKRKHKRIKQQQKDQQSKINERKNNEKIKHIGFSNGEFTNIDAEQWKKNGKEIRKVIGQLEQEYIDLNKQIVISNQLSEKFQKNQSVINGSNSEFEFNTAIKTYIDDLKILNDNKAFGFDLKIDTENFEAQMAKIKENVKDPEERLKQLKEAYKTFQLELDKKIGSENLKDLAAKLETTDDQLRILLGDTDATIETLRKLAEQGVKVGTAEWEEYSTTVERVNKTQEEFKGHSVKISEGIGYLTSSFMSLTAVINASTNAHAVFADESATGLEKIGAGIGMVITSFEEWAQLYKTFDNLIQWDKMADGAKSVGNAAGQAANATKDIGNASKLAKSGLTGAAGAARALSISLGVVSAIITVATIALGAWTNHLKEQAEAAKEAAEQAREQADQSKELLKSNTELIKSMEELYESYVETGEGKEELDDVTKQLAEAYDLEGAALARLTGSYADYKKVLDSAKQDQIKEAKNTLAKTDEALEKTKIELFSDFKQASSGKQAINDISTYLFTIGGAGDENREIDILDNIFEGASYLQGNAVDYNGLIGDSIDLRLKESSGIDGILAFYDDLNIAKNSIEEALTPAELTDSGTYSKIKNIISQLSETVKLYRQYTNEVDSLNAYLTVADTDVSNFKEYNDLIAKVKSQISDKSIEEQDNIIKALIGTSTDIDLQKFYELSQVIDDIVTAYGSDWQGGEEPLRKLLERQIELKNGFSALTLASLDWSVLDEKTWKEAATRVERYQEALENLTNYKNVQSNAQNALDLFQQDSGITEENQDDILNNIDWEVLGITQLEFLKSSAKEQEEYLKQLSEIDVYAVWKNSFEQTEFYIQNLEKQLPDARAAVETQLKGIYDQYKDESDRGKAWNEIIEKYPELKNAFASFEDFYQILGNETNFNKWLDNTENLAKVGNKTASELISTTEKLEKSQTDFELSLTVDNSPAAIKETQRQAEEIAEKIKDNISKDAEGNLIISPEADTNEIDSTLTDLINKDYEIAIKIKSSLEEEYDSFSENIQKIQSGLSLIGEGFTVSIENAKALSETFPGILNEYKSFSDGVIQLDEQQVQIALQKIELDKEEIVSDLETQHSKAVSRQETLKTIVKLLKGEADATMTAEQQQSEARRLGAELAKDYLETTEENSEESTNAQIDDTQKYASESEATAMANAQNAINSFMAMDKASDNYTENAIKAVKLIADAYAMTFSYDAMKDPEKRDNLTQQLLDAIGDNSEVKNAFWSTYVPAVAERKVDTDKRTWEDDYKAEYTNATDKEDVNKRLEALAAITQKDGFDLETAERWLAEQDTLVTNLGDMLTIAKFELEDIKTKRQNVLNGYNISGAQKSKSDFSETSKEYNPYQNIDNGIEALNLLLEKQKEITENFQEGTPEYLESLEKEREILAQINEYQAEKLNIANSETERLKNELAAFGAQYDAETQKITNYDELINAKLQQVDAINKKLAAASSDTEREKLEEELKYAEAQADKAKELADEYNDTIDIINDINGELRKNNNEIKESVELSKEASAEFKQWYDDLVKAEKELDKLTQSLDDEIDKYYQINKLLNEQTDKLKDLEYARDSSYGKSWLNNQDNYIKGLQEEQNLQKENAEISKKLHSDYGQRAANAFNSDIYYDKNGMVSNYEELMEKANAPLREKIDAEKAAIEALKASNTKENEDAWKIATSEREAAENTRNEQIDLINSINEYAQNYKDAQDRQEEIARQILDENYQAWEYKMNVRIELDDMELKQLNKDLEKLEEDIFSMSEAASMITDDFTKHYRENVASLNEERANLEALYQAGEITQEKYVAGLKEISSEIEKAIDDIEELDEKMMNYYGDTLEKANEELEFYTSQMEHLTDVLDHYKNIVELINGEYDYERMSILLEGQAHNLENEMEVATKWFETLDKEKAEIEATLADPGLNDEERKKLQEAYKPIYEAWMEAHDDMLSKTTEWVEATKAVMENTMAQAARELELAMTDGIGFDALNNSMDRLNEYSDIYLTKTNQVYEIQKMMRTAAQAADKTNNAASKERLKNFMNELGDLQEKNQLSNLELEIAQKKYDLLEAQIALEETQNAKNTVRLQRDSNGNFGYVYTADQTAVAEAEEKVYEAEQELYNLALESANDYAQKRIELQESLYNDLVQLEENRVAGMYATEEEYNQAREQLIKEYNDLFIAYEDQYNLALEADGYLRLQIADRQNKQQLKSANELTNGLGQDLQQRSTNILLETGIQKETWTTHYNNVLELTKTWRKNTNLEYEGSAKEVQNWATLTAGYLTQCETAYTKWQGVVTIQNSYVQTALSNTKEATNKVKEASDSLNKALVGDGEKEGLVKALGKELEAVRLVVGAYITDENNLLKALGLIEKAYEDIRLAIEKANEVSLNPPKYDEDDFKKSSPDISKNNNDDNNKNYNNNDSNNDNNGNNNDNGDGNNNDNSNNNDANNNNNNNNNNDNNTNSLGDVAYAQAMMWQGKWSESQAISYSGLSKTSFRKVTGYLQNQTTPSNGTAYFTKAFSDTNLGSDYWKNFSSGWNAIENTAEARDKINQELINKGIVSGATGMYTGAWGPEGRLAILHEKEIVLNKEDTKNFLHATDILRSIANVIDLNAMSNQLANLSATVYSGTNGSLEQSVHIEANFPNATDRNEIEEAFNNLINTASQYANRKNV